MYWLLEPRGVECSCFLPQRCFPPFTSPVPLKRRRRSAGPSEAVSESRPQIMKPSAKRSHTPTHDCLLGAMIHSPFKFVGLGRNVWGSVYRPTPPPPSPAPTHTHGHTHTHKATHTHTHTRTHARTQSDQPHTRTHARTQSDHTHTRARTQPLQFCEMLVIL